MKKRSKNLLFAVADSLPAYASKQEFFGSRGAGSAFFQKRTSFFSFFACLLLAGLWSIHLGLDDNWDLQNYHIYNPAMLLAGELGRDINVVGNQSTFYPLLDIPYFVLAVDWLPHMPRLVCFLAGLPYGVLVWLVFRGARLAVRCNRFAAFAAAGIGLTGTTAVSEIGTTFGDIPIAAFIIAGLLCGLRGLPQTGGGALHRWNFHCAASGGCLGIAAALKLTAAIFAPPMLVGLLICAPAWRTRLTGAAAFASSASIAFALFYGAWGAYLFAAYQNPFFPFLNNIFHSAWGSGDFVRATKFFPRSWLQAVFYPFYWLRGMPMVASETGVRDWHFALAFIAIAAMSARAVHSRFTISHSIQQPRRALLCVFVASAFIAWEAMFSILRYALPLEALTGCLIVAALDIFLPPRRLVAASALAWLCLLATSGWPGWGRVRATPEAIFAIEAPTLADGTTIAVASEPVAFVIPFLRGENARFVGVLAPLHTRLEAEIAARLAQAHRLDVLLFAQDQHGVAMLSHFGVGFDPATCQNLVTHRRAWGRMVLCSAFKK